MVEQFYAARSARKLPKKVDGSFLEFCKLKSDKMTTKWAKLDRKLSEKRDKLMGRWRRSINNTRLGVSKHYIFKCD